MPALAVNRFGDSPSYSILDTVFTTLASGNYFISFIILIFSVIFPIIKLVTIIVIATYFLRKRDSIGFHIATWLFKLGKYSMLDVFVIAILIVVFKMQEAFTASVEPGLYFFVAGIFFSAVSSGVLVFGRRETSETVPSPPTRAADEQERDRDPPARAGSPHAEPPDRSLEGRYLMTRRYGVLLGSILLLLAGLVAAYLSPHGSVDAVLVRKQPGVDLRIISIPDAPDYSLEFHFEDGGEYRTDTVENTPIGNGILFQTPSMLLEEISEIRLWEDNSFNVSDTKLSVIPDEIVDRVMVQNRRSLKGQRISFELKGKRSLRRLSSYSAITLALVILLIGGAVLVWDRARSDGAGE